MNFLSFFSRAMDFEFEFEFKFEFVFGKAMEVGEWREGWDFDG